MCVYLYMHINTMCIIIQYIIYIYIYEVTAKGEEDWKTLTRFPAVYMVWTLTSFFQWCTYFWTVLRLQFWDLPVQAASPRFAPRLYTMCAFFCAESHISLATKHKHLQHFNTKQKRSKTLIWVVLAQDDSYKEMMVGFKGKITTFVSSFAKPVSKHGLSKNWLP